MDVILLDIFRENAILIKFTDGGYVDLDKLNSFLDYIGIYQDVTNYHLRELIMSTSAHYLGSLFVDEESLKPYYDNLEQTKKISVHRLKKEVKNNNR